MRKWEHILLILGAVAWVALQNLWPYIGEKYYFIGDSIIRLVMAIIIFKRHINLITSVILWLAINDLIDDLMNIHGIFRWTEYVSFMIALIMIILLLNKRRRCKKNLIG